MTTATCTSQCFRARLATRRCLRSKATTQSKCSPGAGRMQSDKLRCQRSWSRMASASPACFTAMKAMMSMSCTVSWISGAIATPAVCHKPVKSRMSSFTSEVASKVVRTSNHAPSVTRTTSTQALPSSTSTAFARLLTQRRLTTR